MFVKKWFNLSLILSIALLAVAAFTTLKVLPAQAAGTIVVNSTADDQANDGECTLREAIIAANTDTASGASVGECAAGSGVDTIEFNIGPLDGSVKTITLDTSVLPDITSELTIDGYTQDTATPNTAVAPAPFNGTLLVEINGQNTPDNDASAGLLLNTGSDNSVVKGLVINRFPGSGIGINPGVDGVIIRGNYVGTDPTGMIARPNKRTGINTFSVDVDSGGPTNGLIGGSQPADRNILSGNSCGCADPGKYPQGISIAGGANNWVIKGNYVGIAADGVTPMGNDAGGITVDYIDGLVIGGSETGAANIFSGNGDGGIQPDYTTNMVIQGNYIGTDYTGTVPVPNASKGISIAYGSNNILIGGDQPRAGNVIANAPNGFPGVYTTSAMSGQPDTDNISIIGNSIFNNDSLGIDVNLDGLTLNDPLDSDTGSNGLLNYPEYSSVTESAGNTTVNYRLDVPVGNYRIEFFANSAADPSGHGEGETYLGFQNISHGGNGKEYFTHELVGVSGVTNLAMTATQRDNSVDGFGATSEFGGQYSPVPDVSATKTLMNPQDVTRGAIVNYDVAITNNGPDKLDLTEFSSVGTGPPLFLDMAPSDLTPTSQLSAGPLPDSFFIDAGNPDVTCLWAGPGSGGLYAGLTTFADYSVTFCWYTGALTELAAGSSISSRISFTIANNSSLVFTNYVLAGNPAGDPDGSAIGSIYSSGGDVLELLIGTNGTINNFASAPYPVPTSPGAGVAPGPPSPLAAAGTNEAIWIITSIGLLATAALLTTRLRKNAPLPR